MRRPFAAQAPLTVMLRRYHVRRLFADRNDAGRRLSALLAPAADPQQVVVLGLPRDGVPVAYEIAAALGSALDILAVRKLGVPGCEELAMGAVAAGGIAYLIERTVRVAGFSLEGLAPLIERAGAELADHEASLRAGRPPLLLTNKVTVLVDDGLATGATMHAAIAAVRRARPQRIVVAVPVAPPETCEQLRAAGVDVVCLASPEPFGAVGAWYRDFTQVNDDTVRRLLHQL